MKAVDVKAADAMLTQLRQLDFSIRASQDNAKRFNEELDGKLQERDKLIAELKAMGVEAFDEHGMATS